MTPKEKADELISVFNTDSELAGEYFTMSMGVECAIRCVGQILNTLDGIYDDFIKDNNEFGGYSQMKKYYLDVKKELENYDVRHR